MSDTPRTDAVEYTCESMGGEYLPSSCMTALLFARQLEREVAELRERCAKVCDDEADAIDGRLPDATGGRFAKKFAANGLRGAGAKIRALKGKP